MSAAALGLLLVIAVAALANFTGAFTVFHEIFFRNNFWLLDARTDLLINMFPEGFFEDIALLAGGLFAFFSALGLAAGVTGAHFEKKRSKRLG